MLLSTTGAHSLILRLDCSEWEKQNVQLLFPNIRQNFVEHRKSSSFGIRYKSWKVWKLRGQVSNWKLLILLSPSWNPVGFYFELPISLASKDIWNRRGTRPQYQELLGSRLRVPIHLCVKYKYHSRTPCWASPWRQGRRQWSSSFGCLLCFACA